MLVLLLTLLDGSSLVLKTDNLKFDVQTRHGVLIIPASDVLSLSFGVRYNGDESSYANASSALDSDNFKERDAATKFLAANKRGAYKYLAKRPENEGLEGAKRVKQLLESYAGFPQVDDRVVFVGGSVLGTVKQEFLEGTSESLGKLKVPVRNIASISISKNGKKIAISQADGWREVGCFGGPLKVRAKGEVDLWPQGPGQFVCGPNGSNQGQMHDGYPAGALLGKIGNRVFLIGDSLSVQNVEDGVLEIRINPSPWGDGGLGEYEVQIGNN